MVSQLAGCVHRWDGSRGERLPLAVATTEDGLLRCCYYDLVRSVVRQYDVCAKKTTGGDPSVDCLKETGQCKESQKASLPLSSLTNSQTWLACGMRRASKSLQQRVLSLLERDDLQYCPRTIVRVTCAVYICRLSSHPIYLVSHTRTHSAVPFFTPRHHNCHYCSHTQQPLATHFLLCLLTALLRPTRDPFLLSLSCQRRTRAA